MEQLELKEIVGYLPYGVKAEILDYKSDYVGRQYDKIIGLKEWSKEGDWCLLTDGGSKPSLNRVKPILFPLSSLTEYREDLGFVPIEYLGYGEEKDLAMTLMFDKDELIELPYRTIQKLYEWKIDIHNLIEKGLAIAVTEEFNPYK
jgi:hypothetical protein